MTDGVVSFGEMHSAEQMQSHVTGSKARTSPHLPLLMRGILPVRRAEVQLGSESLIQGLQGVQPIIKKSRYDLFN